MLKRSRANGLDTSGTSPRYGVQGVEALEQREDLGDQVRLAGWTDLT